MLATSDVGAIVKVLGNQYHQLAAGYDLEKGHFQKWLTWWLLGR